MANSAAMEAAQRAGEEPTLLTLSSAMPSPGMLVATVTRELDLGTARELDTRLRIELHRSRPRSLVVDLSGVQFLGPARHRGL